MQQSMLHCQTSIRKKRENFEEIRDESIRLFRGKNHTSFRSTAYSKSTIASAGLTSSSRIKYSLQPDIGILATKIGKLTLKPEVSSRNRKLGLVSHQRSSEVTGGQARLFFRSCKSRNTRNA